MFLSRYRYFLLILVVLIVIGSKLYLKWYYHTLSNPLDILKLKSQVEKNLEQWIDQGELVREDGHIYTVDTAQIAIYAAQEGKEALYQKILPMVKATIVDIPGQEYTVGMISWRIPKDFSQNPDFKRDASGTTEALRVAEALWLGHQKFKLDHMDWVKKIILAYQKHQTIDQNQWMIRNYYNLQTQAFAPNSYAVDYDPDFLWKIAQDTTDPELKSVAQTLSEKSADLLAKSISPSGLVHQVMLPEIMTLLPTIKMIAFSPNGIEMINNALTVAERCVHTCPSVIEATQKFLHKQEKFGRAYQAITGESLSKEGAGIVEYAAITRFACYVGDTQTLDRTLSDYALHLNTFLKWPAGVKIYVASEVLMGLTCLERKYAQKISQVQ